MNPARNGLAGLLAKVERKPPKFAFAVSLYRSDLLFRSLVDLAVVGALAITFTFDWSGIGASLKSAVATRMAEFTQADGDSGLRGLTWFGSGTDQFSKDFMNAGVGTASLAALAPPRVDPTVIATSGQELRPTLEAINADLDRGEFAQAEYALGRLDPAVAITAYARAVVTINRPTGFDAVSVQRDLRVAADRAVAPAITLLGEVQLSQLTHFYEGKLAADCLFALDGAGNPIRVQPKELSEQAMDWWRRASEFNEIKAKRYLGLMAARGVAGKPDMAAAAAFWREAADLGDAPSAADLALMYMTGIGVSPDQDKAIALLRKATGNPVADVTLAVALGARIRSGDRASALEAFNALERAIGSGGPPELRSLAHHTYALYLFDVAPVDLRNAESAVGHLKAAVLLGDLESTFGLGIAYYLGAGVPADPVTAYAYFAIAATGKSGEKAAHYLSEILPKLTPEALTRARSLRLGDLIAGAAMPEAAPERKVGRLTGVVPGCFRETVLHLPGCFGDNVPHQKSSVSSRSGQGPGD